MLELIVVVTVSRFQALALVSCDLSKSLRAGLRYAFAVYSQLINQEIHQYFGKVLSSSLIMHV